MTEIKMIITDLDNTFLRDDKTISSYTYDMITACKEKGIKFVPATARVLRKLHEMNFIDSVPYDALICCNGSKIYLNEQPIYQAGISPDELTAFLPTLLNHFGEKRITIEAEDTSYANHNVWEVDPTEAHYIITNDFQDIPPAPIDRIILNANTASEIEEIAAILPDTLYVHPVSDAPICRILHKQVSKAVAIDYLCNLWNITPAEIVTFGDDHNDIEMFQFCGQSIAMANAIPELVPYATARTTDNNHDGVARWLEQHILNN